MDFIGKCTCRHHQARHGERGCIVAGCGCAAHWGEPVTLGAFDGTIIDNGPVNWPDFRLVTDGKNWQIKGPAAFAPPDSAAALTLYDENHNEVLRVMPSGEIYVRGHLEGTGGLCGYDIVETLREWAKNFVGAVTAP